MMRDLIIAQLQNSNEIWVGNGLFRRHIADLDELEGIQFWIEQKGGDTMIHTFADLRVLGIDIKTVGGNVTVDTAAVVAELADRLLSLRFVANVSTT